MENGPQGEEEPNVALLRLCTTSTEDVQKRIATYKEMEEKGQPMDMEGEDGSADEDGGEPAQGVVIGIGGVLSEHHSVVTVSTKT